MDIKDTLSAEPENDFHDVENRLVYQLKQVCDQKGREVDVAKSERILHQLGKVYSLRGQQGSDLLNLIQSAALYNAAIARSTNNAQEIESDLSQLCKYVLVKSRALNQNADLIEHAKHVKNEFETLRENVKQKLKSIPQITKPATNEELKSFEKEKVILIRQLQIYITVCYTKIMADLAKYCHRIIGNAPCRFAIIGMGSLARKEITPYSDFEHIIVLEDEIVKKCTQNEMEEVIIPYFKWFSIVFHIIVINLQETILPSVAIPTLNDFYSEVQQNNWFSDVITTRGIAFDGLMPHNCKLPIGRQKPTKQKNWKTELIKPVTNMLEYLTAESQLKNGYHLGEILTKTCFVYGDQAIYVQFNAEVVKILYNQSEAEKIETVTRQINEDLDSFSARNSLFQLYMKHEINIKQLIYRSSTVFIGELGRLFSVLSSSCFEIIEKLAEMNVLTEFAKHKHMYTVALACEIRLRWYVQCKSQTDVIVANSCDENAVEKLFSIVGKPSTTSYFQMVYALQCDISKRLNLKKIHFYSNPQLLNFNIGICLGLYQLKLPTSKLEIQATKFIRLYDFDTCLQLLEDKNFSNLSTEDNAKANSSNAFDQLQHAGDILFESKCYDDALEYYQKSLQTLTSNITFCSKTLDCNLSELDVLCKSNCEKAELLSYNLMRIGNCLIKTNASNTAMKYLEKSEVIQKKMPKNNATNLGLASVFHLLGQCCIKLRDLGKARTYFESALQIKERATTNAETDTGLAATLHELGRCLLNMNQHIEALSYLQTALQIAERATTNAETDTNIAETLHELGCCLLKMNQLTEALKYFQRALQIDEQAATNAETDINLAATFHELGCCLLNMNQLTKALEHFQRALQIYKQTTMNAEIDTSLATTLHELGRCLLNMNQHTEALNYFQKALKIKEQATTNAETDTSLAVTLHELGRCLLHMNQHIEALNYFQTALQIDERVTANAETDTSIATTLHELGSCLLHMNQLTDALNYFQKALQIKERATRNAETDTNLATTLHELGHCLLNMNQLSEALDYFQRALQIYEQATTNCEIDVNLATTLHSFGRCLLNMNQHTEALKYFQRAVQIKERTARNVETDASLALTLYCVGRCYSDMDQPEKALTYFNKCLEIEKRLTVNAATDEDLLLTVEEIEKCSLKLASSRN